MGGKYSYNIKLVMRERLNLTAPFAHKEVKDSAKIRHYINMISLKEKVKIDSFDAVRQRT